MSTEQPIRIMYNEMKGLVTVVGPGGFTQLVLSSDDVNGLSWALGVKTEVRP